MKFEGLHPLTEGFPHIELQSGEFCFDVHNSADLIRMGLDFETRQFEVEWRVENLLASSHYGPYRTARLVVSVAGISAFSGFGQLDSARGESPGIDFIEYIPSVDGPGLLRFVFTSSGAMSLSGTECKLIYSVLD